MLTILTSVAVRRNSRAVLVYIAVAVAQLVAVLIIGGGAISSRPADRQPG